MLTATSNEEYSTPPSDGACKGKPLAWFFPDPRTRGLTQEMLSAINTCRSCKFQYPCAQYGLRHEIHGIWGGLTEQQRVTIRQQRNITVKVPGFIEPVLVRGNNVRKAD